MLPSTFNWKVRWPHQWCFTLWQGWGLRLWPNKALQTAAGPSHHIASYLKLWWHTAFELRHGACPKEKNSSQQTNLGDSAGQQSAAREVRKSKRWLWSEENKSHGSLWSPQTTVVEGAKLCLPKINAQKHQKTLQSMASYKEICWLNPCLLRKPSASVSQCLLPKQTICRIKLQLEIWI